MPADVQRIIAAATCERDRLLLRVLWATGARVTEALGLRPCDIHTDHLVLLNEKNPGKQTKAVYFSAADRDLAGELLLFVNTAETPRDAAVFRTARGPLCRSQAWRIIKDCSRRAGVLVLAMRDSKDGPAGAPAPVHPHLLRHARVRQILRSTRSLPLAMKQAGWSRIQQAYLTLGDEEARQMMQGVPE